MDSTNQPTTSNPGTLHLVVHRPMEELNWLVVYLKDKCIRVLGREHSPDEDCNRIHCHFAIEYNHTKQALTKFLNSKDIKGSDNFGILSVCQKSKKPYDFILLSQYILKGIQDATVVYSGITDAVVETCRANWKSYREDGKDEREDKAPYNEWEALKKAGLKHFITEYFAFDDVRRYVMRWYWKRDGRLPHATSFKRNASSLYLLLIEKYPNLRSESAALDEIMEKYY